MKEIKITTGTSMVLTPLLIMITMILMSSITTQAQTEQKPRRWHFEVDLRYQQELYRHDWAKGCIADFDFVDEQLIYKGMKDYEDTYNESRLDNFEYGGNTLMLYELYDLNRHMSIGAGLGIGRSFTQETWQFPLFATLHYKPWSSKPHTYLYSELGWTFTNAENTSGKGVDGLMFNLGVGKSFNLGSKKRLDLKIGYHLQQLKYKWHFNSFDFTYIDSDKIITIDEQNDKMRHTLHHLQLSAGLVF